MRYEWIGSVEEFSKIAPRWDAALAKSRRDNPFLLSTFIITWWKYFSRGRELWIFALYDGDELIGGVPLCLERRHLRRRLVHVGGYSANVTHFLLGDIAVGVFEAFRSGLEKRTGWDVLELDRVLQDDPTAGLAKIEFGSRFLVRHMDNGLNGVIDLGDGKDAVIARLPERLRRYLKSCKQKALQWGTVRLERVKGASKVRALFEEYVGLSVKAYRVRGKSSAFEDHSLRGFFDEILQIFDCRNMLYAHRLVAGPETLGISFGYKFGRGFKWILTSFNPALAHLRPGHLLIEALVAEAIENEEPIFDMYYGGELDYKQQWCNKMLLLRKIEVRRKSFRNQLLERAQNFLRAARTALRAIRRINSAQTQR